MTTEALKLEREQTRLRREQMQLAQQMGQLLTRADVVRCLDSLRDCVLAQLATVATALDGDPAATPAQRDLLRAAAAQAAQALRDWQPPLAAPASIRPAPPPGGAA